VGHDRVVGFPSSRHRKAIGAVAVAVTAAVSAVPALASGFDFTVMNTPVMAQPGSPVVVAIKVNNVRIKRPWHQVCVRNVNAAKLLTCATPSPSGRLTLVMSPVAGTYILAWKDSGGAGSTPFQIRTN